MSAIRSRPARRSGARGAAARNPPAIRQPSPLISRAPETSDDYLARLALLTADPDTHIYFDASFLMWLVKLGRPARGQFLEWVAAEGDARFHVPLWAAHEFFKHQVDQTIWKEFGSELSGFDKAATRLFEKIRSYCCDDLFGFANAGDIFLDEYRRSVQPLRAMLALARSKGKDEIKAGLDETAVFIDRHLLAGPLGEVIEGIESEERVRNRGVIPPGFQDAHKRGKARDAAPSEEPRPETHGDNSFGDIVFWREAMRHASGVSAKALIIATGDRKNDWFVNYHGDKSVSPDLRKRVLAPRPVPLAQPLLVREAADRGAGELVLVDPVYCGALMSRRGARYAAFAAAAMDIHLPQVAGRNIEGRVWAARLGRAPAPVVAATAQNAGAEPEAETGRAEAETAPTAELGRDALTAGIADCSPDAASFLNAFAAADVAARAELISGLDWAELEAWTDKDLVVLGATMLRAAEDGDPSAASFVSDLRDQVASIARNVAAPVYLGTLRALYFDDAMERRPAGGSSLVQVVLDLVALPMLESASSAIGELLSDSGAVPLFLPGSATNDIAVEVITQPSADNKAPADLLAIKVLGRDLTTDLQDEEPFRFAALLNAPAGTRDYMLGALIDLVARFHLLPRKLLTIDEKLDGPVRVAEFAGVELDP
jgi:hypothetical protein